METAFTIMALAAAASLIALVLRQHEKPMALLVTLAAAALICAMCLSMAGELVELGRYLGGLSGLSWGVLEPVLKVVVIGAVTKIAADVCREAGETAIGSAAELAGSVCALYVSLPLLRSVMEAIVDIL